VRYDFEWVSQLCPEIGLSDHAEADRRVEVDLGDRAILCLDNEHCLIGFNDVPWRFHDNLMLAATAESSIISMY